MNSISAVLQGFQLALLPNVEAFWIENPRLGPQPNTTIDRRYSLYFDPIPDTPEQPPKPRRHSRKGKATGWIEERQGNKQRKNPSTSYYYGYYDAGRRKQRQYVQVHLLSQVRQMIDQRCSVAAVLQHIHTHSRRKEPKQRHQTKSFTKLATAPKFWSSAPRRPAPLCSLDICNSHSGTRRTRALVLTLPGKWRTT